MTESRGRLLPLDLDEQAEQDRVICKDGRVFHACEICRKRRSRCDGVRPKCTSCQKRGLECEYRAMRKRGRHGKKSLPLDMATASTSESSSVTAAALLDAGSSSHINGGEAAWPIASPLAAAATGSQHQSQLHGSGADLSSPNSALSLLDSFPRFFSMPSDLPMAASVSQQTAVSVDAVAAAATMDSMIHALNSASPPAHQQPSLFPHASPMSLPSSSALVLGDVASASLPVHADHMHVVAGRTQPMGLLASMTPEPSSGVQVMQHYQQQQQQQFQGQQQQQFQGYQQQQQQPQGQQQFHQPQGQQQFHQQQFHHQQLHQQQLHQQQLHQQQLHQQQFHGQQQLHGQRLLSPDADHAALTSALLTSIGASQNQRQQQQPLVPQPQHHQQSFHQQGYRPRQSVYFGPSAPPSITIPQHPQARHPQPLQSLLNHHSQTPLPQPPMAFRSLSANSSAFDGSSLALSPSSSSLSMAAAAAASMRTDFASPIGLGAMLPPASPAAAVAAAAAAAAVAAFQFSPAPQPLLPSSTSASSSVGLLAGPMGSVGSAVGVGINNGCGSRQGQEVAALLATNPPSSMLSVRLSAPSATQPLSFSAAPLSPVNAFALSAADMSASCLSSPAALSFSPPTVKVGFDFNAASAAAAAAAASAAAAANAVSMVSTVSRPGAASGGGRAEGPAKSRGARSRQGSVGSRANPILSPQSSLAAAQRRVPGGRRAAGAGRRRSNDWNHRTAIEEELVLDGLNAEGADHFGRPLFDVSTYPLPGAAELDEHMNGMFEYFYMGVQTMHEVTFRKRISSGNVSPVLIYAIMAIASRYSRRPSLHSLNGMAFLNGDRHASTACGLASILLNHGDLGAVDTIHGMLFLSVYFMGQGNMLKSRMYLVKAVCTARTMGFQNMDATFVPTSPMIAFSGNFDKPQDLSPQGLRACSCPRTVEDLVTLETKRRIWWFLVFVDYFTANVMNVPLEIPPDSYCVRLPCSDEEWMSPTLSMGKSSAVANGLSLVQAGAAGQSYSPPLPDGGSSEQMRSNVPRDLGFGDRLSSAQHGLDYLRRNGFHDCRPPWLYHPGAFYLERLMIEFCDHLRRLNNLRSLAIRSFFHVEPVFVDETYPYLKRRRQNLTWVERLDKVKGSWSWLHMQLNKWLDSILLRFSEVITRVPSDQYNRQYRHQYYYYLIAAHSTIIMSHGVILQLFTDFSRYIRQQQQQQQAFYEQQQQQQCQTRTQTQTPTQTHAPLQSHSVLLGLGDAAGSMGGGAGAAPWASPGAHTPPVDYGVGALSLSEGLSEFAIGTLGSAMAPLINIAQSLAASGGGGSGSSVHGSSVYGSVIGSPVTNPNGSALPATQLHAGCNGGAGTASFDDLMHSDVEMGDGTNRFGPHGGMAGSGLGLSFISTSGGSSGSAGAALSVLSGPNAAINILRDLSDMAMIAWDGCVSTAEQLASILRGKHPKFVLLGGPPLDVFREQVLSGDANILSLPGSAFNAPGTGPGADNPILSDPDFYMRLQPSTAWWMFLVAQVQVGHIKRLLKESEGNFKVSAKRKALAAKAAAAKAAAEAAAKAVANGGSEAPTTMVDSTPAAMAEGGDSGDGEPMDQSDSMDTTGNEREATAPVDRDTEEQLLGIPQRLQKPAEQMRPLSTSVNNSAAMLATAVHMSNSAPAPPTRQAMEKRAAIKMRASRLVRAYENLSCMVKVLEGMQQYWQCMDYVSAIQEILKGSEHPLH
ncbi:hypothetical protein GGI04_000959 [Coemansia thaxteri]|nr:hypothetical protein GGI04_000959 [Coemansia thaxteri]